jgi:hypothetical protein
MDGNDEIGQLSQIPCNVLSRGVLLNVDKNPFRGTVAKSNARPPPAKPGTIDPKLFPVPDEFAKPRF